LPFFDLTCANGHEQADVHLRIGERPPCPICGEPTETLWRASSAVIQDSIEGGILIRHGLCDPVTGAPMRYDSKSDIAREAKRRGLVNYVTHQTAPDSDKSSHTTPWTLPPPPGVDPRPTCMLSPEEQRIRHEEWMAA
jgi:hypothetical protein